MLEESTTGSNLSRKATLLMAEILHLANRVLPLSVAANLQVSKIHSSAAEGVFTYLFSPQVHLTSI